LRQLAKSEKEEEAALVARKKKNDFTKVPRVKNDRGSRKAGPLLGGGIKEKPTDRSGLAGQSIALGHKKKREAGPQEGQ